MPRSLALDVSRAFCVRLRRGWRDLPGGTFPRLLLGLLVAFVVAMGVTIGLTMAAKGSDSLHDWDTRVMEDLAAERGPIASLGLSFTDGIVLESYSNIAILGPLTLLCIGWSIWREKLDLAATFALTYVLARFLIWTGWWLWPRSRPDLIADGAAALSAHSFPSGHVALTFTTYGLLAVLLARAGRNVIERIVPIILLLVLATIVGLARLRLGAHWPSDTLAGGVIGIVWLTGVSLSLAWARRKRSTSV